MIAYSERTNCTSEINGKPRVYSQPDLSDKPRFAVVPCGTFYQVRARRYATGRLLSDQLVSGELTERDADDLARHLTEKGEGDAVYSFID